MLLTQEALKSFESFYNFFTDVFPRFKGTILSGSIENYLELELSQEISNQIWQGGVNLAKIRNLKEKLLENRAFEGRLFYQLKAWAEAELLPPDIVEHTYEGKVLFTEDRKRVRVSHFRRIITDSYKDIICLVAFKHTLEELVTLARYGDDSSFFKLVYLDKLFLTAKFAEQRIRLAQAMEDYSFLKKLSNQIAKDGYRDHLDDSKRGMAIVLLWFLGGKDLTYKQLESVVKEQTGYKWGYPESFVTFVNRLGLYRYPKKRHERRKTSS